MTFRQVVTIDSEQMEGITIPFTTVKFIEQVDDLNSKVCNEYTSIDEYQEFIVPTKALKE